MRGRSKPRSLRADGKNYGLNMCPDCIAFFCDPSSMSPVFQNKIYNRRRQGFCPCCGQPKEFCKCKSSVRLPPGIRTIRTHNNKKLKAAKHFARLKENSYRAWVTHEDLFIELFGEDAYHETAYSLHLHKTPSIPWEAVTRKLHTRNITPEVYYPGWH